MAPNLLSGRSSFSANLLLGAYCSILGQPQSLRGRAWPSLKGMQRLILCEVRAPIGTVVLIPQHPKIEDGLNKEVMAGTNRREWKHVASNQFVLILFSTGWSPSKEKYNIVFIQCERLRLVYDIVYTI